MNTNNVLRIITFLTVALVLAACSNKKFTVKGEIANAADSVLYFENISLDGPVKVDSVKLSKDGQFSFSEDAQTAPEFYRLRIDDQIINISIDSTETVTVKGQWPALATSYTVEGSEQCKLIQELAYKQIALQQQAIAIQKSPEISYQKGADSIKALVDKYREEIKLNYIFKHPDYASSYFALFQAIGSTLIFNPRENEEDIKAFGAVATSWDTKYPESLRGENLHNITVEGMNNIRYVRNKMARAENTAQMARESGLIDIRLTDNHGKEQSLQGLAGKVVLLDFHVFAGQDSPQRIMSLRELYNKYHGQGFEIYQVSLDADKHFWKTQTDALPWISVNDPDGVNSRTLLLYNVQSVPTFFLINKNNELVKRDAQIKDIDAEIKALL
ncbi:MAG: AhpC/TSA family protein [Bacteroidaceae bacterium]|nr:AhpC/TSA family protein [Bacteroidaceae bacterium]